MIKLFCTLFLGASSLAWSMDTVIDNRENTHPNIPNQESHLNKVQIDAVQKESHESIQDNRTPEEIEKRIDFLESKLAGYQSFNEDHYKVIQQLMEINFFNESFPKDNTEALSILESVFTNNHGKGGPWGYIVRELYRRPQRFIKEFDQLVDDVMNKESEKNENIRKILSDIYSEIGPVSFMIVYYLDHKS